MFEIIISILVLIGAVFTLIGSIGLVKLPDFFTRLHAPTKATTLGVGAILLASTLYFTFKTGDLSLHEVLITLFLFITAPVSAHLMAKSAIHIKNNEDKKNK
ncbi:Na+/H+ antiporter subunit G [Arcobacter aquimarinus]|uniref:Multisubunit sodium:proton antiporter, MnhG subunit n=1 Tax=Arcobacter aquimarinus TaxID=1315211 RepID=A0AAE7B5W1_9BACT|nr:Na+/H+ antiporter subunit G [Arcobacter aquimarinus]MCB9096783.1 Na+/H+ antiporter subunit G [Arcobacter sp.]QKE26640.1 multisubunit sodium:proton antiporter, MnhG subunit [Arcobacter aquimarinus]RXI33661.1 Na+/H+ antiporter subunit G [Arcobacter aquimarinus]